MICPVCKQRWAPIKGDSAYVNEEEREKVFKNNEIRCCQDDDCLVVVDDNIKYNIGKSYDELVEETKKELEEGKIK